MLIVTRRIGEEIVIGGDIRVRVVAIDGDRVRLGTTAPQSVTVDRLEVHEGHSEFAAERELSPPAAVDSFVESLASDLTDVAYRTALRHGVGNQWLELQLDLWEALTEALEKRTFSVEEIQPALEPRLNAIDQDN
jgi:carbon storage regulator